MKINKKKLYNFLLLCTGIFGFVKLFFFKFIPKKSKELYDRPIAHRGFHMFYPENTLDAYNAAIDANMAIETDIRFLNDGNIVCFHDRYTSRLLKVPGKLSMFPLERLKKYYVSGSTSKIPTLKETLDLIDGKVDILIEVKGKINNSDMQLLKKILLNYCATKKGFGDVYLHTKNISTYFKLKKEYHDKVFYILNPFRKRFQFVKGSDYKEQTNKYNTLRTNVDIEIPTMEDFGNIITHEIQNAESKNEILAKIGSVCNEYETRIDENSWVNNSVFIHRGITSSRYLEHSKESFLHCIEFAESRNINVTVEFDVMLYAGQVRCYHNDRIPDLLGQEKSCAEKMKLENSLTLKEILNIFAGHEKHINLAIDVKDYRYKNRSLEQFIIDDIESSNFKGNFIIMSYNPLVLNYFKEVRPEYLRAQIGHSLKGLRKVPFFRFPWLLNGILGILFDKGNADCSLFDNSNWIFWMIAYHKNIKGKPVLIYAPKSIMEIEGFVGKETISNFIIEDAENKVAWPDEYFEKFKVK